MGEGKGDVRAVWIGPVGPTQTIAPAIVPQSFVVMFASKGQQKFNRTEPHICPRFYFKNLLNNFFRPKTQPYIVWYGIKFEQDMSFGLLDTSY